MKALTIWQPWASLLADGEKRFETRSWATSYRGPIAIHAAAISVPGVLKKTFPHGELEGHPDCQARRVLLKSLSEAFKDYAPIEDIMGFMGELPIGEVIAAAELVGCHRIVLHGGRELSVASPGWLETERGIYEPTEQELTFGNWTRGRYAWEFTNMKMIAPTPAKGRQGLWNWEGEAT